MADITQKYIGSTTATITLDSLANGSGRGSTAIDNTSVKAISADIMVQITTNATSGTSATGYLSVYLIRSDDGTNYEGGFAGTDGAYTPTNAILLGTISAVANNTFYSKVFDTAEMGLSLPQKYCIGVVNSTGASLKASGNAVRVETKGLTVA
jgi:hypothetical protein